MDGIPSGFGNASHERLRSYPAKFDMEFHPFATLDSSTKQGHFLVLDLEVRFSNTVGSS
jgi:hypothetical protein